ncbi:hypothetical protein JOD54_004101 [Actinokineospora baliensis]|uniref:hypothetical protein n=1 Tax=Actinokineospora baliensis TaxID=547056 RepID=UPI001957C25E|nr:hypothetical protein [Actinokineospora baliensis]MBM7773897.1 hypothetical protein [Actinokineospora baliensis]
MSYQGPPTGGQHQQQPEPPPKTTINTHGLFGVLLILAAVGIAISKHWDIPWLYFLVGIVGYAAAMLALTFQISQSERPNQGHLAEHRFTLLRAQYGAHLTFLFLIGGLLLPFDGFWLGVAIFIASLAAGMAIPFLLVRQR